MKTEFFAIVFGTLALIVGFLAVMMTTGVGDLSIIEPSKKQHREAAIYELNLGTPKDVGNGLQLDRVMSMEDGVLIQFELMQLASTDVNAAEFHDLVFEASRRQMCLHPDLRSFIDAEDGSIEAQFRGNDSVLITSMRFDQAACQAGP